MVGLCSEDMYPLLDQRGYSRLEIHTDCLERGWAVSEEVIRQAFRFYVTSIASPPPLNFGIVELIAKKIEVYLDIEKKGMYLGRAINIFRNCTHVAIYFTLTQSNQEIRKIHSLIKRKEKKKQM